MQEQTGFRTISRQSLARLPEYLQYLRGLPADQPYVSSRVIAEALHRNEVQVRKDLAAVSTAGGKPRIGFERQPLMRDIEAFLGYDNLSEAVLVGVGQLGRALLSYADFDQYGVSIVAAFDEDDLFDGMEFGGKPVFAMTRLENLCRRLSVHIGIIAVPPDAAQDVCDRLIQAGVEAILNLAPARIQVPEGILLQNETIAGSLALLSRRLREKKLRGDEA